MRLLRTLASDLLDLFAPHTCTACRAPHPNFPPVLDAVPSLCALCAIGLHAAEDPPAGVVVPFAHGGPIASAIHHAKYGDDPSVARRLGTLLEYATRDTRPAFDVVIPVPLHPRRLAARGFNQAVELARALTHPIAHGAVVRVRNTSSQVGFRRGERIANVHDAFAASAQFALRGLRALVVDDVVTTGATLAEVAKAARSAGAIEVHCLALTRAPLDSD